MQLKLFICVAVLSINLAQCSLNDIRQLNAEDFQWLAGRLTDPECDSLVDLLKNTGSSEASDDSEAATLDCLDKLMELHYLSNVQSMRDVTAQLRAINRHDLATQLKNRHAGNKARLENELDQTNSTKSGTKEGGGRSAALAGDGAQTAPRVKAWLAVLLIMLVFSCLIGLTIVSCVACPSCTYLSCKLYYNLCQRFAGACCSALCPRYSDEPTDVAIDELPYSRLRGCRHDN